LDRDDPIADYFVLYNTPYFDVDIVDVVCCGLRLNYVANRAALEFSWSHRASNNRPYDREREAISSPNVESYCCSRERGLLQGPRSTQMSKDGPFASASQADLASPSSSSRDQTIEIQI
jgi:hypothetical protein